MTYRKNCLECNKDFISKRVDARFCEDLCRTTHNNRIKGQKKIDAANGAAPVVQAPVHNQNPQAQPLYGLHTPPSHYPVQNNSELIIALKEEKKELKERLDKKEIELKEALALVEKTKSEKRDLEFELKIKDKMNELDTSLKGLENAKPTDFLETIERISSNDKLMGIVEKVILKSNGGSEESGESFLSGTQSPECKDLVLACITAIKDKDVRFLAHYYDLTEKFKSNPEGMIAIHKGLEDLQRQKQPA